MTNKGMRWNCAVSGCFNEKLRPRLEVFRECFPRGCFGDVDGLIELNGCFALLEWKSAGGVVKLAQLRSYLAFTKQSNGNTVFLVGGVASSIRVRDFSIIWRGKLFPRQPATLNELKARIRAWAEWAETRSAAA
jgi:hypothetical protein